MKKSMLSYLFESLNISKKQVNETKEQLNDQDMNIIKDAAAMGACGYPSAGLFDVQVQNNDQKTIQNNKPGITEAKADEDNQFIQNTLNPFF